MDEEEVLETLEIRRNSLELIRTENESSIRDHDGSCENAHANRNGEKLKRRYESASGEMQIESTATARATATGLNYCWTGFVFLAFFGLGMAGSIVGPTLLDLACHTNSKLENMSYLFTSRSVGYLTGSMVGGWLYDKFNKLRVLSLSCLVATLFMWVSPLSRNLYVLMVLMAVINLAGGCLDTGGNVLILQLWQEKSHLFIQMLHFVFAAGAFVTPLLVKPFLLPTPAPNPLTNSTQSCNHSDYGTILPATWGYWIASLPFLVSGVGFLAFSCLNSCSARHIRMQKYITDEINSTNKGFKFSALALFFLFFLLYVGVEVAFSGYIFVFGAEALSKDSAAYLTSVFWGSFAIGRFLSIPIAKCVTSNRMLMFDLLGCFIGSAILISQFGEGCSTSVLTHLWVGTALLGLAMASVFPCAISLAESSISLSGRTASLLLVGGCVGDMTIPLVVGIFFVRVGPCFLMYSSLAVFVLITIVYILIEILGRTRRSGTSGSDASLTFCFPGRHSLGSDSLPDVTA